MDSSTTQIHDIGDENQAGARATAQVASLVQRAGEQLTLADPNNNKKHSTCPGESVEQNERARRTNRLLPDRFGDELVFNPKSLLELCLDQIGLRPNETVLQQDIHGIGEDMLAEMLVRIVRNTNLTVPLVRHFQQVARDEHHERISLFLSKLDIFAAIGPGSNVQKQK